MVPPIASTATQTIATITFGIVATLIGVFTIWQGRKAWRRLYRHQNSGHQQEGQSADSETESRD